MALRNQPYFPLYVQDFMTDEKLSECSAEATGVYIRLMCILHKSEEYGRILLKQKDKQTSKQILNFATKLAKNMPYDVLVIERSLNELTEEGVISIDGDYLKQKRMIKDCLTSENRSKSGKKGGEKTSKILHFAKANNQASAKEFAKAKVVANSEYEYEIENEYEVVIANEKSSKEISKNKNFQIPEISELVEYFELRHSTEIEAAKFYNFYQSKNWMVGKSKMKDWKAAANGWVLRNKTDFKNGGQKLDRTDQNKMTTIAALHKLNQKIESNEV